MRVLNKHTDEIPEDAEDITRGNPLGNPFKIGIHGDRHEVIELFEEYLPSKPELMEYLHTLKGRDLVCCCRPKACHGYVIKKFVARLVSK